MKSLARHGSLGQFGQRAIVGLAIAAFVIGNVETIGLLRDAHAQSNGVQCVSCVGWNCNNNWSWCKVTDAKAGPAGGTCTSGTYNQCGYQYGWAGPACIIPMVLCGGTIAYPPTP